MKRIFCCLMIVAAVLSGCGSGQGMAFEKIEESDKLVVYTSHKQEVYEPIIREFEERTGIWVEVVTGGTNELLEKIKEEKDSRMGDVMFGGGVDSLEAYGDYLAAYVSKQADQIDPAYQSKDQKYVCFSKIPMVIIYNKKLVYEKDIPRRWADLLNKDWKGQIAFADPEKSGSCYTALVTLIQVMNGRLKMEEVIHRFAGNLNGQQCASSGSVVQEVQNGNKVIGVVLEETVKKQLASCPDIEIVYPEEGISMPPDGCAILKNAPHKANAQLFMEFVVCDEVQQLLEDQLCRRSVRKDVEEGRGQEELIYDMVYAQKNRGMILKKWYEEMK